MFILVKNSFFGQFGTSIEIIWVKLHINNSPELILLPSKLTNFDSTLDKLHVSICEKSQIFYSYYPSWRRLQLSWNRLDLGDIHDSYICFHEKLITLSQDHFLNQVVTFPDLCFTTHPSRSELPQSCYC